jgi:hypothetical protein
MTCGDIIYYNMSVKKVKDEAMVQNSIFENEVILINIWEEKIYFLLWFFFRVHVYSGYIIYSKETVMVVVVW